VAYNRAMTNLTPIAIRLDGKVALVTGAARGIGAAVAARLAAQGARVVVADIDADGAAATASAIGAHAVAQTVDVRDRASFVAAIDTAVTGLGSLDILVNNAALTIRRPFFEIEDAEWDEVLAINLRGVFLGCQLAGAWMRDHGGGRIVNLSSLAGQQGSTVNGAHYAASKAGILALTKSVARELAPAGVTVNAVSPAVIEGPLVDALPPVALEGLIAAIPLGRIGRADEVASLIAYLASDAAAYVTGATFDVNGGSFMR
jgi:3-oxoacyl-[acyl-carrier protein] reductase